MRTADSGRYRGPHLEDWGEEGWLRLRQPTGALPRREWQQQEGSSFDGRRLALGTAHRRLGEEGAQGREDIWGCYPGGSGNGNSAGWATDGSTHWGPHAELGKDGLLQLKQPTGALPRREWQ
jgi:hypothetical protein